MLQEQQDTGQITHKITSAQIETIIQLAEAHKNPIIDFCLDKDSLTEAFKVRGELMDDVLDIVKSIPHK